jgi:hypothetical protein
LFAGASEQCKVDFQAGKKHQQQFSELCHEIRNRPDSAENVEDIGSDDDAAEQQAHRRGNVQSAGYLRNDHQHHHPQRKLRQHRQGEEIIAYKMNAARQHASMAPRSRHQ